MLPTKASGSSAGQGMMTKALTVQEYKRRLRDNVRSLNENFINIINAAKIATEDQSLKVQNGRMAEFYSTKNEMTVRAALIVKACDELMKLSNDLKEFLILHDFNYLTQAIKTAEDLCDEKMKRQSRRHAELRVDLANIISDVDKELLEHFSLRS